MNKEIKKYIIAGLGGLGFVIIGIIEIMNTDSFIVYRFIPFAEYVFPVVGIVVIVLAIQEIIKLTKKKSK